VYDGHCGDQASIYLQAHLHNKIAKHPSYDTNLCKAIRDSCLQIDEDVINICKEKDRSYGTTALGVFIRDQQLTAFNVGDSHAVMSSSGVAVDLSSAHKPSRSDEHMRIVRAKGWITEET
jgi:serine/threonine protein phosphatase PrpC